MYGYFFEYIFIIKNAISKKMPSLMIENVLNHINIDLF